MRSRGKRARENLSTGFYRETIPQERTSWSKSTLLRGIRPWPRDKKIITIWGAKWAIGRALSGPSHLRRAIFGRRAWHLLGKCTTNATCSHCIGYFAKQLMKEADAIMYRTVSATTPFRLLASLDLSSGVIIDKQSAKAEHKNIICIIWTQHLKRQDQGHYPL